VFWGEILEKRKEGISIWAEVQDVLHGTINESCQSAQQSPDPTIRYDRINFPSDSNFKSPITSGARRNPTKEEIRQRALELGIALSLTSKLILVES
jgi:hypothetical protein